jgi:predicted adenylyl cyclase CyaB
MAFNLEIKLKTNSHKDYIKILKSIGAEYCGVLKQKDVYFKVPSGLLKLRIENNKYTLIKYNRNEKGKRWSNYEILKLVGKNPEKYLTDLFKSETVVMKKRILYLYNNTRIHLDEVKGLGKFLELETLLVSGKKDAALRFKEMLSILKIDPVKQIHTSYKNLIRNK